MGGPKIFPSLQTVPWSEELWRERDCLVFGILFFQRDWGHIEERIGIGNGVLAQSNVSQVQCWAALHQGPVTFGPLPCPYLCLDVDWWILPGMVDCVLDCALARGILASVDGNPCLLQFFLLPPWTKALGDCRQPFCPI